MTTAIFELRSDIQACAKPKDYQEDYLEVQRVLRRSRTVRTGAGEERCSTAKAPSSQLQAPVRPPLKMSQLNKLGLWSQRGMAQIEAKRGRGEPLEHCATEEPQAPAMAAKGRSVEEELSQAPWCKSEFNGV